MRKIILRQPAIVKPAAQHQHTAELRKVDEILGSIPRIAELIHKDLVRGLKDPATGRQGSLSSDQLFRVLYIKQMNGFSLEILNAKSQEKRLRPYKDLLCVTSLTVAYAEEAIKAFELAMQKSGVVMVVEGIGIANELSHYVGLAKNVIDQTERRVLNSESVPATEKVVSIFEPHTDIIIKDRRDTLYGHKIVLTGGASGLFTDLVVLDGNPADATLAVDMVQRQKEIYGRVPLKAAFDGGFASKANLQQIKELGSRDVTFRKKRGLSIADMAKSTWVYKRMCDFRAGIEGMISFLKRCFGLRRCAWQGFESFKSYAWSSVVTANLLLMARHMLA